MAGVYCIGISSLFYFVKFWIGVVHLYQPALWRYASSGWLRILEVVHGYFQNGHYIYKYLSWALHLWCGVLQIKFLFIHVDIYLIVCFISCIYFQYFPDSDLICVQRGYASCRSISATLLLMTRLLSDLLTVSQKWGCLLLQFYSC